MKTKKEIMEELTKKSVIKFLKNPEEGEKDMLKAMENQDLAAITSGVLSEVLTDRILLAKFSEKSKDDRQIILFKTIFSAIKIMRDTETAYEEQFKVDEPK